MGKVRKFLISSVVAAAAGLAAVTQADAARAPAPPKNDFHPALWKVEKNGSTVYVFGSYHILNKDVRWMTPSLLAVLQRADAFVFEVPVGPEAMPAAQEFIDSRGYLPQGQSLRAMLSPQVLPRYQQLIRRLPLKPKEMDKLRPWLAQLTLSSSVYSDRKFSVLHGADVRILSYAIGHGKAVSYLETPRQQLEFFFEAAGRTELAGFEALINTFDQRPKQIDSGIAAWVDGDVDELSMRLHRGLADNPAARKILLDDRNASWSQQIEQMLDDGKTYFVTVGVGHLGGPASVIENLCKAGHKVARIATANETVGPACTSGDTAS
jgi:uncharacterized protein